MKNGFWDHITVVVCYEAGYVVSFNNITGLILQVVLAGCSPYLRAMFTNGMLETDKNVIEIHGVDAQTMNMLLEFMYKGKQGSHFRLLA